MWRGWGRRADRKPSFMWLAKVHPSKRTATLKFGGIQMEVSPFTLLSRYQDAD